MRHQQKNEENLQQDSKLQHQNQRVWPWHWHSQVWLWYFAPAHSWTAQSMHTRTNSKEHIQCQWRDISSQIQSIPGTEITLSQGSAVTLHYTPVYIVDLMTTPFANITAQSSLHASRGMNLSCRRQVEILATEPFLSLCRTATMVFPENLSYLHTAAVAYGHFRMSYAYWHYHVPNNP